MGASKHLLRNLPGQSVDLSITYKRGGFKLAAYSDTNWGNNPDNGRSTSSYIVMLASDPISVKVGLQSLTVRSITEAELVAAALTMKEAVFCSNMMVEIGFEKGFSSVPLYLDNTSTLQVVGNRTYSIRVKHITLRYLFVHELVQEGKITTYYLNTQDRLADPGTKHLGRHHHRALIKLINDFEG